MHALVNAITEFLWQFADIHAFVYYVTACLVLAVCWFIREIVGTSGLAIIAAPVLMATGLITHIILGRAGVQFVIDKDTNVAMTAAIGVLFGLSAIVILKWLMTIWKEQRVRARHSNEAPRTAH